MRRTILDPASAQLLREKLLILGLVNTIQPTKLVRVIELLSSDFDRSKLKLALTFLRQEGMLLSIGGGHYIVSQRGRHALGTGPSATQRDIARMLHLSERSKGGRELD